MRPETVWFQVFLFVWLRSKVEDRGKHVFRLKILIMHYVLLITIITSNTPMGILQGSFVDICFSVDSRYQPSSCSRISKFFFLKFSSFNSPFLPMCSTPRLETTGGGERGESRRSRPRWRSYSTVLRVCKPPAVLEVAFWMLISSLERFASGWGGRWRMGVVGRFLVSRKEEEVLEM